MGKKANEFAAWMERYKWIREVTDEAIAKRSLNAEFHGIEQELRDIQQSLIETYNRTKPIKHPRDKGDQREEILRQFLSAHGLIPNRYAISQHSCRVISPTGHMSPEVDIVIYDKDDTIVLKKYDRTLEYFPIESVHGTIQVKSKLTKKALMEALDNIRAFKTIKPVNNIEESVGGWTVASGLYKRFGILFAFEYDLEWGQIIKLVRKYAIDNGISTLPNLIFILDKGHFKIGDRERYCWHQSDVETISDLVVYGFPDHERRCLRDFYILLMDLLKKSTAGMPDITSYIRMPITAGKYSFSFSHGAFVEIASCKDHGSYLKKISERNIEIIIDAARKASSINWIRALDIAEGSDGKNADDYLKQPAEVRIYNPRDLPLRGLISNSEGHLTFESIIVEEMTVWLPWKYVDEEGLIEPCPKCQKPPTTSCPQRRAKGSRARAASQP